MSTPIVHSFSYGTPIFFVLMGIDVPIAIMEVFDWVSLTDISRVNQEFLIMLKSF